MAPRDAGVHHGHVALSSERSRSSPTLIGWTDAELSGRAQAGVVKAGQIVYPLEVMNLVGPTCDRRGVCRDLATSSLTGIIGGFLGPFLHRGGGDGRRAPAESGSSTPSTRRPGGVGPAGGYCLCRAVPAPIGRLLSRGRRRSDHAELRVQCRRLLLGDTRRRPGGPLVEVCRHELVELRRLRGPVHDLLGQLLVVRRV